MRVDESIIITCRPSAAWELIGDPSGYDSLMSGVTRWDSIRSGPTGVGARYAMRMRVGSADVGGEVEVVEYEQGRDLAWTGVTGIEQRGRWRIREVEPGVSRVTLRIAYQSPGGLTGLVADRLSAGQVRKNVRRTLGDLRNRLEGDSAAPRSSGLGGAAGFVANQVRAAAVLGGAGVLRPVRPDRLVGAASGAAPLGSVTAGRLRHGRSTAP